MTERISMNHGSGGQETATLIHDIFLDAFKNPLGDGTRDAAILEMSGRIAFTSDSFVVRPMLFPGGDIGRLAICGTVNDLLTSGANPKYLSASFILEEGLPINDLRKIVHSMAETAHEAGVMIVTGDTKVIEGQGGLCINTAGIGELISDPICFETAQPGDALIISGTLGDHHAAILSARMEIQNSIQSDAAPLCEIVDALTKAHIPLHGMRDITRGGLATVINEIIAQRGLGAEIDERALPISEAVRGLCSILGLDPLYMGNEGNMLLVVPPLDADRTLSIIQSARYGQNAKIIGHLTTGNRLTLKTSLGGQRLLRPLIGESLPRIC